jgi:hypothetical protein
MEFVAEVSKISLSHGKTVSHSTVEWTQYRM